MSEYTDGKIRWGFTEKPLDGVEERTLMAQNITRQGGFLVRPCLVHGKRIVGITEDLLRSFVVDKPRSAGNSSSDKNRESEVIQSSGAFVSAPEKNLNYLEISDTDGLVTNLENVILTSTHGDCIPLWAYDPEKNVIGVAHAGWKGTLLQIGRELALSMINDFGCNPENIKAFVGPGIGRCHFEVGKEVAEAFMEDIPWSRNFVFPAEKPGSEISEKCPETAFPQLSAPEKYYIDLKAINRKTLENCGITDITVSSDCTFCLKDRYYSYRRCKDTKRMLAWIEIV